MDHKFPVDADFVRENVFMIAALFMDTIKK